MFLIWQFKILMSNKVVSKPTKLKVRIPNLNCKSIYASFALQGQQNC